jgi:site-specific DNA recombinase
VSGSTRSLRSVPEPVSKALGLIRVSKERDGMVSPEVQRVAITDYCRARGYEICGWLEGLDESGSRARSAWWPRLDQGVDMVEAGTIDVVVVWKFSRTARNRLKWAVALDRVESAGGRLESATEQVDATTSTGRFTRGMLAELNAFEAERIGEVWKEVHSRRVRAGKPASGKPKWGYLYDRDLQLHVPDPVTGPVLADVYARYVAGESVHQLVRWLNAHGWRTTQGGVWSDRSLRRVLDAGFAAGYFMAGGDPKRKVSPTVHRGVHEPLISEDLWQAYQDARGLRRARPARSERSQYLLSGLVRCGRCGGSMVAGQYGARHEPKYRCKAGKESGPEVCAGGYVTASYVEGEVLVWLRDLAADVDAAADSAVAASARRTTLVSEGERLAREIQRVEDSLQRLLVQQVSMEGVPDSVFVAARTELTEQHAALSESLEATQRAGRRAIVEPAVVAAGLLEEWDDLPVPARREVLRDLVARVRVWTGRPRATVVVEPAWDRS